MLLKKIQALCEQGQYYAHNEFDMQRYHDIEQTVFDLIEENYAADKNRISILMEEKDGYKTPKVDIRAVVFNHENKILMVREKVDGKWALPGGWADVGYSPSEVAVKEAKEEAGAVVVPVRLIALQDKKCHDHPEDLFYIYKVFIECQLIRQEEPDQMETSDWDYFDLNALPPLSTPRNTSGQIQMLFDYHEGKINAPLLD